MRAAPLLFIILSAACGARSELDDNPPDAASCVPSDAAAPRTCSTWQVAGPDRLISEATDSATISQYLGSVIPVGCGVLLSWSTSSPETNSSLTFTTRAVAFDGTTTGPRPCTPPSA